MVDKGFNEVLIRNMYMISDLNSEKIILEVRELILNIDSVKDEINVYCDLMKQMFLSSSNQN